MASGLTRVKALGGTRPTIVFMSLAVLLVASLSLNAFDVRAAEPPASLTLYRCYTCHSDRETLAGPAFSDVAAVYRGRRDAETRIATEIRAGLRNGGPWHMPPHPEVSPDEARVMARYIMSLAPPKTPRTE